MAAGCPGPAAVPVGFQELAEKLKRPFHPPGRDVHCIVSVGMLTEGWDCNTVTHIIGLRPFMSQLLCEQVVGRGLRRRTYAENQDELFSEEVAKVFGVPFDVIPFKQTDGPTPPAPKRDHIHAIPEKARHELQFPRVVGYTQAVRNRIAVDWDSVPITPLDPLKIPGETQVKGLSISTKGRMSLGGPGRLDRVTLEAFRKKIRLQRVKFALASDLTRVLITENKCEVPAHKLFPQAFRIVDQYFADWVRPTHPFEKVDAWHSPFYGQVLERLRANISPDTTEGEAPEIPIYEQHRGLGSSADVDFWTSRRVFPVEHSHVNYVVADTRQWEQSSAYFLDTHPLVRSFVKNAGLGFAIPCFYMGQEHDYIPDFVVRLDLDPNALLILETKGFPDEHKDDKAAGARRWVNAVNADGRYGFWDYDVADHPSKVADAVARANSRINLMITCQAFVTNLTGQLGPKSWRLLGQNLAQHIAGTTEHTVDFADFETLARDLNCSVDNLCKAVETLSHPETGPLQRTFVRPGRGQVTPEEVVAKARDFYVTKSMAPEDWSKWASGVHVAWMLRGKKDSSQISSAPPTERHANTILLVEDDPSIRQLTSTILADYNCDMIVAHTSAEALRLLESGPAVDLVIIDIAMPAGSAGREILEKLHRSHPKLPLLFTTSRSSDPGWKDAASTHSPAPELLDENTLAGAIRERLGPSSKPKGD